MLFRDLHRDPGNRIDRQSEEFSSLKVSQFITYLVLIMLLEQMKLKSKILKN